MIGSSRKRSSTAHTPAIFGLPHNYSGALGVLSQTADRRASPLLVHIHKLTSQNYIAVLSIIRANFLPENDRVWIWQGSPKRPDGDPQKFRLINFVNHVLIGRF